jgi:hypothetical protein
MGGLIVSGVSFAYLVMCFVFARKAYRAEYRKIYGAPAPRCYGGKIGHDRAHELAIREGVEWLAMWPLYLGWALVYRLISGPVPAHVKLDEIQAEVDRLAEKQDPLKDLDQTYGPLNGAGIRTEKLTQWTEPEIIRTAHPERLIWTGGRLVEWTPANQKTYGRDSEHWIDS